MRKTFVIALTLLSLVFNCALVSQEETFLPVASQDETVTSSANQEEFLPTDHSLEAFAASKKYTVDGTREDNLENPSLYPKKYSTRVLVIGKRPEKYEVGKPDPETELKNHLEENLEEGDWGGYDWPYSYDYGDQVVHIYCK